MDLFCKFISNRVFMATDPYIRTFKKRALARFYQCRARLCILFIYYDVTNHKLGFPIRFFENSKNNETNNISRALNKQKSVHPFGSSCDTLFNSFCLTNLDLILLDSQALPNTYVYILLPLTLLSYAVKDSVYRLGLEQKIRKLASKNRPVTF